MTKIISIANQKGGVGKTTVVTQLAFDLALKQKAKVLVIDMDAQGNATKVLMQDADITGQQAHELFDPDVEIVEPQASHFEGIDILPTEKNSRVSYLCEMLPVDEYVFFPKKKLEKIADRYDFIIIDCPPNMGTKLFSSLAMSTHVLCPVRLCGFAMDGLVGLLQSIQDVQNEWNPSLKVVGVLFNGLMKSVPHQKLYNDAKEALGDVVFKNHIPSRSTIDTATTEGCPIWLVQSAYVATKDMRLVNNEIYERMGFEAIEK